MIEMRWVHRNNANDFYCGYFEDSAGYPRVLQYRHKLVIGAWGCIPPTNSPTEWSDWIDVPTQEENQ